MPVDVQITRERQRRRRLRRIAIALSPIVAWMWLRILAGNPVSPGFPSLGPDAMLWLPMILIVLLLGVVIVVKLGTYDLASVPSGAGVNGTATPCSTSDGGAVLGERWVG